MGSPAAYAKVAPRLRVLKASLLGPRVREIGVTAAEALAALRDTMYSRASEAKDPRSAEASLARAFFSAVDEVEAMCPEEARGVATAVARAQELRDLMTLARSLAEGSPLPQWLPSFEWQRSPLRRIAEDLAASPSIARFADAVSPYRQLSRYASESMEFFGELKDPATFTWYSLTASAAIYRDAIEGVGGVDRDSASRVLCPLLEEAAALGVLEAWGARLSPRVVERAYSGRPTCGLNWSSLAASYERSLGAEAVSLAQELSGLFKYVRLEGRTLDDLMRSARRSARLAAQRAAEAQFSAYPFSAGLVAAASVLLYIDFENVRTALLSLMMGLQPEEYQQALLVA